MTRWARVAGMAAVVAMATACGGDPLAGRPVPAGNEMRTPDTSDKPATPARPREIRLQGKDPCALVSKADWGRFAIDKPGEPQQDETLKSPECFYSARDTVLAVTLVMNEGIEAWRSGNRMAQPAEVAPIQGFPAISLTRPNDRIGCDIVVDVAEGQYLLTTVVVIEDSAVPERCAFAHRLAESAMNTLVVS